ncbi:MAG: hypothetical protein EP317_00625 [Bacillota bacterium]|nr:MAG: hypothetical protein EP317_00625 [Bacillota bacterium]
MKKWFMLTLLFFSVIFLISCESDQKSFDSLIHDAIDAKQYQMEVTFTEDSVSTFYYIIRNDRKFKVVGDGAEIYILADEENAIYTDEVYVYYESLETYLAEFSNLPFGNFFDFFLDVFFFDFNMNWFVRDGDSLKIDTEHQPIMQVPFMSIYHLADTVHIYKEEQTLFIDITFEDGGEINMNVQFSDVSKIEMPENYLTIEQENGYEYVKDDVKTYLLRYRGSSANLKIPELVGHGVVTTIGRDFIKNFVQEYIELPASLEQVNGYAFHTLYDECKIVIPLDHQLKSIKAYAFQGFTIDYVLFEDTTIEIERNAFTKGTILFSEEREAYEHVELEASDLLTLIYGVDEVIVENGMVFFIKNNQAHLVKVQAYISNLVIPSYIQEYPIISILPYALEDLELNSLSFEEDSLLLTIDDYAFEHMTVDQDIHLPKSLLRISRRAFAFVEANHVWIHSESLIIESEAFIHADIDHIYFSALTTTSSFQSNWNPLFIPYTFGND